MSLAWETDLRESLGTSEFYTDEEIIEKSSKDYYWYSPVLSSRLKEKKADAVIAPREESDVEKVLALSYRHRIPVTVRGSGTGNYGQSIPLEGGIVLDISGLDRIVEIGEDYARVQCGVKMGALEKKARELGKDLRIYPSTFAKSTIGGFISGGSGGVGSITWGNLWDGNVSEAVILTMEETPRRVVVKGEDLYDYIHSYGTTGILTQVVIPLAPKTDWVQAVVQFDDFSRALQFGEALGMEEAIPKRLVSPFEWPIPAFFKPLKKVLEQNRAAVFTEVADGTLPALNELAQAHGGHIGHVIPAEMYRKTLGLSDFTWNHATLWAIKADPSWTYLQAGFSPVRYLEQVQAIKRKLGDEVLMHVEWMRSNGQLTPTALPIVRFTTEERLQQIVHEFLAEGIEIYDPHTWLLSGGGRGAICAMKLRKQQNDPLGLLNPGKLETE